MSLQYEIAFDIRHYECDAFGHVNHGVYLQWMQEAALRALASAGYDITRPKADAPLFQMRANDITYFKPLTYGDSVRVCTRVIEANASHIRNEYLIHDADSGEIAAKGVSEWVLMLGNTLEQRPIPESLVQVLNQGALTPAPPPDPFPDDPPLPEFVYTLERAVEWRDLDFTQLVNGAAYMYFLENISWRAGEHLGWPMTRMMAMGQGFVARRYRTLYLHPARLGDVLRVATWASQPRRATGMRHYTIHHAQTGRLLVRAHVLWVWVDFRTGLPKRIPQALLDDFAPNISRPQHVRA
jgi:acyl-CoA thioester hydrolase